VAFPKLAPRERKTLMAIVIILLFIVVLTFLETFLHGVPLPSSFIPGNIIVFVVVNIHIILLMILVLLVLRNLVKLYFEHRQKILGSRFKTKLMVAFTLLSIIPTLVLFLGAMNLVRNSIQNWFEIRVEDVLRSTTDIAKSYYQLIEDNNRHYARRIANAIAGGRYLLYDSPETLLSVISSKQREFNLSTIQVFDRNLVEIVGVSSAESPAEKPSPATTAALRQALAGKEVSVIDAAGTTEIIRCLAPVALVRSPQDVLGVIMVSTTIPLKIGTRVQSITRTYESYRQSTMLRRPILASYQMILVMIALLSVFFATWFAFYLARLITVPIQSLAEGTRRISQGDLDVTLGELSSNDELGMLVGSFNHMAEELRASRRKLDTAYSALQRNNLELAGGKRYIETVLDNIATGVLSIDGRGTVTTINLSAQRMLSISFPDIHGKPFGEVFAAPFHAGIRAFIEDLHHGMVNRLERRIDLAMEDVLPQNLLLVGTNLHDERGIYAGTVVAIENLTELTAVQRIAAWREVARRIAHEIKNPLTPIKLSAQRLRKKHLQNSPDFDAVFDEGTQVIIDQVEEMRRLVDEFSRFARMPASHPTPTDIHAVLEDTLRLYRETYRQVEFLTSLSQGPLMAMADPGQMKRVFINLIDNGIEAMEGHGTVSIETRVVPETRNVRIVITDTGKGLTPDIKEKLFSPYFSTKKDGTGLGLAIVNGIIADHGGSIRVRTNRPHGTAFVIEIPAAEEPPTA
jgi:two-component system nitrogen regulation sensor histidine kinase NtrY